MLNNNEKIVDQVIQANKEAYEFYHSARYKTVSRRLAATFARLEELHKIALFKLHKKLHIKIPNTTQSGENIIPISLNPEEETATYPKKGIDAILLKHMKERKQMCIQTVKKAMNTKRIHILNKIFLKNLLYLMQERYELERVREKY